MAGWRLWLAVLGLVLLALALAGHATADPDPPPLDGGTTTFLGNWTVDPGDRLAYVNQTIVLDGNLTIDDNGTLELSNCTLVVNCTFDGQHSVSVLANGTMSVTNGSLVRCPTSNGDLGARFTWTVLDKGRLTLLGSSLVGAGWDGAHPGLVLMGGGNLLENSTVADCFCGVTLEAGISTVQATLFLRCDVGVMCEADGVLLVNVSAYECMSVAVWAAGCDDLLVWGLDSQDCGEGVRADAGSDRLVVVDASVRNSTVGLNLSADGALVRGLHAEDCDVGLLVRASRAVVTNVTAFNGSAHPTPVAGVRVVGPAAELRLSNVTVSGAIDGILIEGDVTNLTLLGLRVPSARDGGVAVAGAGDRTSGLRLENLDLVVAGASYGVALHDARNVTVLNVTIDGPPLIGMDIRRCADVWLQKVVATASQRIVSIDGEGTLGNVTLTEGNLDGGDYGLWVMDTPDVTVNATTVQASAFNCVLARRSINMTVSMCIVLDGLRSNLEAYDCDGLALTASVLDDAPYNVYIEGATGVLVSECFVMSCDVGLWLAGCVDVVMDQTEVVDAVLGFHLESTLNSTLTLCTASRVTDTGMLLDGGTTGMFARAFGSSEVRTGVRIEGEATSGNVLEGLTFQVCVEGIVSRGANLTNLVKQTAFHDLSLGIASFEGSVVLVETSTFSDCAMAIEGDDSSWVNWTVGGASELSNCSVRARTYIRVTSGQGALNVTSGDLVLLGSATGASQISSDVTTTLRLTGTNITNGSAGYTYSTMLNGGVEVSSCRISNGGTVDDLDGAIRVLGDQAVVTGTTFVGCYRALVLEGDDPFVADCMFQDNVRSVYLASPSNPWLSNCTFVSSGRELEHPTGIAHIVGGEFATSMALRGSRFLGAPDVYGLYVKSVTGQNSVLTVRNTTFEGLRYGLMDDHLGSTLVEGCAFEFAEASVRRQAGGEVGLLRVRDSRFVNSSLAGKPRSFIVEGCSFVNSSLGVAEADQGGLIRDCMFDGTAPLRGAVELQRTPLVTCQGLAVTRPYIGLLLESSSGAIVTASKITGANRTAVQVNSSSLMLEACDLTELEASGARVAGISALLEMHNCTLNATAGRAVEDVYVTADAEAMLLNTTFNKSALRTEDFGKAFVDWYATFELRLPWGGTLVSPSSFTMVDSEGTEIFNSTDLSEVVQVREMMEDSGERTLYTPHNVTALDTSRGVGWSGPVTFDRSRHVVIYLGDGEPPLARAGPDQVVDEDTIVTLDGRNSEDNDPTFGTTGTFTWSFDEYGTPVQLSGSRVEYVFSVPGNYDITLTAKDATGNTGTDTIVVQVRDRTPPAVNFIGNLTIDEDVRTAFDASATTDNDPRFDVQSGRFVWEFRGMNGPVTYEGATIYLTFDAPGLYDATLTAYDRELNTAEVAFWVRVLDRTAPEIAGLRDMTVFSPTSGLLDASLSTDNVGIASYDWRVELEANATLLEGPTPDFTFDRLGVYSVTLTLTDGSGNTNSSSATIVYDDVPVLEAPSYAVAMALERLEVAVRFQDTFHTQLVFRVEAGPASAEVVGGAVDARLVWTPSQADANSSVSIDVVLNDGYVDSLVRVIVWVNPARGASNLAPVITSEPPLAAKRAAPYIYSVVASDPDGDRLWFLLEEGPDGMTLSNEGTLSWDPMFETGTVLVNVRVAVTDGRAFARQSWVVRFREPPNQAPLITFIIPDLEVKVLEEFTIDLGPFLPDGSAFQVDPDDPNLALVWSVSYNSSVVTMLRQDGLAFHFRALDVPSEVELEFTVADPSGATDEVAMRLIVLPLPEPVEEEPWWLLILAVIVVAGAVAVGGVAVASSRRRKRLAVVEARRRARAEMEAAVPTVEPEGEVVVVAAAAPTEAIPRAEARPRPSPVTAPAPVPRHAPTVEELTEEVEGDIVSEELDELLAEVGTFQEVPVKTRPPAATVGEPAELELGLEDEEEGAAEGEAPEPRPLARPFVLEGVAVIGKDGRPLASTGRVEEVYAPVQKTLLDGLASKGTIAEATLEVEGRRVILAARDGVGVLGVIRGREDADVRSQLGAALDNLLAQPERDVALQVIDDLVAATGVGATAEVVRGAWTAHMRASVGFKNDAVVLEVFLRNDTQDLMHNVRLDLSFDHDALSLAQVRPRLLVSQDRISVGNLPAGKSTELEVSFAPELCLSSPMSVQASYTDVEGHRVLVPAKPMVVDVRPPPISPAGLPSDAELLELASGGMPEMGRKAFSYDASADRAAVHAQALEVVKGAGLQQVKMIDSAETMRLETWFAGVVAESRARVIMRVSTHGTDKLLELFAASDEGSMVVGLLTHLGTRLPETMRARMPSAGVESLTDAGLLSDLDVWPTLLEYELEGN